MKKTIILILTILITQAYCQNSNSRMPDIFPPKASVASLFRIDQVPVNLSTGIPDISHSLFNVPIDKNLSYNFRISYHPSQIRTEEIGSELGIGWNAADLGIITRTVNGVNDDKQMWGILDNQIFNNGFNGYVYVNSSDWLKKRLFESVYSNQYDVSSDEYMFSFLGNSGKFVFIYQNGAIVPTLLGSDKNYKIQYERDSTLGNFKSFTITDDKGYQYIFDLFESDSNIVESTTVSQIEQNSNFPILPLTEYKNNWHLTKIKDPGNNQLLTAEYEMYNFPNSAVQSTEYNYMIDLNTKDDLQYRIMQLHHLDYLQPLYKTDIITKNNNTYKLKKINIPDKSVITFEKSSMNGKNFLDRVKLFDAHNRLVNSYKFNVEPSGSKSVLNGIINEQDPKLNYSFHYNGAPTDTDSKEKDNWGYYNNNFFTGWFDIEQSEFFPEGADKSANPSVITTGILDYEISPTKGVREYLWEANTFSQIATDTIEYYNIPENRISSSQTFSKTVFNNQPTEEVFYVNSPQNIWVNFKAVQYSYINDIRPYTLQITPVKSDLPYDPSVILPNPANCYEETSSNTSGIVRGKKYITIDSGTSKQITFYGKGLYKISLINTTGDLQYNSVNYNIEIGKYFLANTHQYLYGGGVRISKINFWDKLSDMNLVNQPKRYFQYQYTDFNNPLKSSGVLNNNPVYIYNKDVAESDNLSCGGYIGNYNTLTTSYGKVKYRSYNNNALVQSANLSGSFVTYSNVKVIESQGYTKNYFTTPLDFNDYDPLNYNYPFLPTKNTEKKYGLIKKSEIYNSANTLQIKDEFLYNIMEPEIFIGAKTYIPGDGGCFVKNSAYSSLLSNYNNYLSVSGNSNYNVGGVCGLFGGCGGFSSVLDSKPIYKKSIVPLLQQKNTTEYHPTGDVSSSVSYNYAGYYLSKETAQKSDLSIKETSYKYAPQKNNTRLINANMVGIPLEVSVTEKESPTASAVPISKSETRYDDALHLFPSSTLSYNLETGNASTDITYDKYDSKGNLQQYTTKDGISTTIIWGYSQSQPIAKITGAKLSDIQQSLIDAIVNASNTDALAVPGNDELLFMNALDTFRKEGSMSGYQITTYTYDPMIGVRSITPPSGIREVYLYDSANRLKEVKQMETDSSGNITYKMVEEFKYNYKN